MHVGRTIDLIIVDLSLWLRTPGLWTVCVRREGVEHKGGIVCGARVQRGGL